ncbi:MAG TPA: cytochrome c maturation protein CcmE [Azospirillum sp.]|nr:cytochrome c maturation protein CcmE [Azospirillum sp.]
MLKTAAPLTALAVLAALALSGVAHAGDHHRHAALPPTGPQPIADVLQAGGGTVAGTVGKVNATWFVLNDGQGEIDVTSRGFLPEGLQAGSSVTVVGRVRRGAIQASQIIRDDGVAFGRDRVRDRRDRHHDDDDD